MTSSLQGEPTAHHVSLTTNGSHTRMLQSRSNLRCPGLNTDPIGSGSTGSANHKLRNDGTFWANNGLNQEEAGFITKAVNKAITSTTLPVPCDPNSKDHHVSGKGGNDKIMTVATRTASQDPSFHHLYKGQVEQSILAIAGHAMVQLKDKHFIQSIKPSDMVDFSARWAPRKHAIQVHGMYRPVSPR